MLYAQVCRFLFSLSRCPLTQRLCPSQAAHGEAGCIRVTEILKEEIVTGMKLLGAKTIKDLKPEMLELMDGLVGKQL